MDFTQAVAVCVSSACASCVVDMLMTGAPRLQTGIHAVLVRVNKCPWNDGVFDAGLNRLLLHIGQQIDHDLTATLHHPKDRWPLFFQGATTSFALESAATAFASLGFHSLRLA